MRLIACILLLFSQTESTFNLTVIVDGMESAEGNVNLGLFNSENGFPERKFIYKYKIVKSSNSTVKVVFENLKKGSYAIAAYHDKNANTYLDKNMVGYPTENFGFTNNARRPLSAPSFEEAAIHLDKDITTRITLK